MDEMMSSGKRQPKLRGVPETLLIPLWARAVETSNSDPIIRDDKAVEMVAAIDYDFFRFESSWLSQVGVSVRTKLLDDATRKFLARNPGGTVVNLGAGLDTRYERLQPHSAHWYDLDLPEVVELRRRFFAETDQYHMIARSVLDFGWMEEIDLKSAPVLIIAEGLLMYLNEEEVKSLFQALANTLDNAEMLFEVVAPIMVGRSKHHDSVAKISSTAEFRWSIRNSRKVVDWHKKIKYIDEWNFYDFHKSRWKWYGRVARLPFLKPWLSNRIVQIKIS